MCIALIPRWAAMDGAMRRDESDTLVRNVHGVWMMKAGDQGEFSPAGWEDALWENRGANNPILFSIAAKTTTGIWRTVSGADRAEFSRVALRMPSLVAGILCCAALFWLGCVSGIPRAGWLGGLFLAIHPWHVRYSTEGRGYALCMLFCVLAAGFLILALADGSWKMWWGYGVAQFLMLYSYTGAVYAAGAFFIVGAALLAARKEVPGAGIGLMRITVVCMMTGGLYVLLLAPCVPQILAYLGRDTAKGAMTLNWGLEALGEFAAGVGMGGYRGRPPSEYGPLFDVSRFGKQPGGILFLVGVVPALWLVGAFALRRKIGGPVAVCLAPPIACLLSFAHNKATGNYLYPWYLIFALPSLVFLLAYGLEWGSMCCRARGRAFLIPVSLFFLCFLSVARPGYASIDWSGKSDVMAHQRGKFEDRVYRSGRIERWPISG